ncbi:MAG: DNA polymerase Y family protein [Candidatus Altimarinota bacterium]
MPNRISYPSAIAHLDCNAFFASVEQAYDPTLKGKPVLVAGLGGGCVITASYEARKYNIHIGTTIWEAKKICPEAIIVPSNFKRYLLYNRNLLSIIREFTPDVQEASIDECYLDLKGLRKLYRKPYSEICFDIKEAIKSRLGISVSIGLSTSKALAKTASNFKKPDAVTVVGAKDIEKFLAQVQLKDIKGIGHNTLALLNKKGIHTPLQFIHTDSEDIKTWLGKGGWSMHAQLQGYNVNPVSTEVSIPKSLARTRSFKVNTNKEFIYQEVLKNLCMAFWHLRKQKLKTSFLTIMLRGQDYKTYGQEIRLPEELNSELPILTAVRSAFEKLYQPNLPYRSSGVITTALEYEEDIPPQLFPKQLETNQQINLFSKIDHINEKYGPYTIAVGPTVQYRNPNSDLHKLYLPFIGTVN